MIPLAEPIPVELHLHATQRVSVDFLALRADHEGGLRAKDHRLLGAQRRPEWNLLADAHEAVRVRCRTLVRLIVIRSVMAYGQYQELAVLLRAGIVVVMPGQLEKAARTERPAIARSDENLARCLQRLQAKAGQLFAAIC